MKKLVMSVLSLSALMMLNSCGASSFERAGDAAVAKAKSAEGYQKRDYEKLAYKCYMDALKQSPDKSKITPKLRNKFVGATVSRALLVLNEGSSTMDALDLFETDIDSMLSDAILPDVRQKYSLYLVQRSDSSWSKSKFYETMQTLDKAIRVAADPAVANDKKNTLIKNTLNSRLEFANMQLDEGVKSKDPTSLINAEYNAKMALYFDSTNATADSILVVARKNLVNIYTAFTGQVEDKVDTMLYRKINKYDILMAVTGNLGGSGMKVSIYNYSYNPIRMYSTNFYVVDVNGTRYDALPSSKVEPEILEREKEATKLVLNFPAIGAEVKKLVYESNDNGYHLSEKFFR